MERAASGAGGPVGELVSPALTVSEHDTLREVARRLVGARVSCAVLAEPPLRVVSERDLARAWEAHAGDDEVAAVASDRPYWVRASSSVADAAALMLDTGIRHLLVVDGDGMALGVVAMTDVLRALVRAQDPATVYASFAAVLFQEP